MSHLSLEALVIFFKDTSFTELCLYPSHVQEACKVARIPNSLSLMNLQVGFDTLEQFLFEQ